MDNFDPYSVLLSSATNISVLLMTAFVLQGHTLYFINYCLRLYILLNKCYTGQNKHRFLSETQNVSVIHTVVC